MRIGALKPIDVETPHGSVRVLSRYRHDKKCYRLQVYGPLPAVQWLLPNREISEWEAGMARPEISHPQTPITVLAELDTFRKMLVQRWQERLEEERDRTQLPQNANGPAIPQTLGELAERYFLVHADRLRARTVVGYRENYARWAPYLAPGLQLHAITSDAIALGMNAIAKAVSAHTANNAFRFLRIVLNYAGRESWITQHPHKRVKLLKTVAKPATWWSPEEVRKVLDTAKADTLHPRDAVLVFALGLYLGLRRGEMDRLRWEDLTTDGDRPVACVRSTANNPTKSGKTRYVPICRELREILNPLRQPSGYVLRPENSAKGKWLYRFEFDQLFDRIVRNAGVRRIRVHDMRHTWVSIMLGKGISLFKVSRWLGHADIRVTQEVYAHLAPYDADIDLLSLDPDSSHG